MRNVLKNHSEVCHVWAQQNQERGKASKMFLRGETIYSYGEHFPIARFAKPAKNGQPGVVLFTTDSYSVTTSKHKTYACRAIQHCTIFWVPNVLAVTKDSHKRNLTDYEARIVNLIAKSSRARDNKGYYLKSAESLYTEAGQYKKMFGIRGNMFPMPDIECIKADIEKNKIREAAAEKKRERQNAANRKNAAGNLILWKQGKNKTSTGENITKENTFRWLDRQYIRLHKQNGTKAVAETTLGVKLLLKSNGKILPFVAVAWEALAYIGCHRIEYAEFARIMNLLK
jgi:hypothetical protein